MNISIYWYTAVETGQAISQLSFKKKKKKVPNTTLFLQNGRLEFKEPAWAVTKAVHQYIDIFYLFKKSKMKSLKKKKAARYLLFYKMEDWNSESLLGLSLQQYINILIFLIFLKNENDIFFSSGVTGSSLMIMTVQSSKSGQKVDGSEWVKEN